MAGLSCAFVSCLFFAFTFDVRGQDFGYDGTDGPDHWGTKYNRCVGKHQSPIDIETENVREKSFPSMNFIYFNKPLDDVVLENNGHTVAVTPKTDFKPAIDGGPLSGIYSFQQLHFHWGPNDTVGSENLINHRSYPLELHMVFYNNMYESFEQAAEEPAGLAVLSFLIELSTEINPGYDLFVDALKGVREQSTKKHFKKFVSLDQMCTQNRSRYFTYEGSLTTPPCSEVVIWIEFTTTVPLARSQIDAFRRLSSKHGLLTHNYRPTQPINDRIIYFNSAADRHKMTLGPVLLGILLIFH